MPIRSIIIIIIDWSSMKSNHFHSNFPGTNELILYEKGQHKSSLVQTWYLARTLVDSLSIAPLENFNPLPAKLFHGDIKIDLYFPLFLKIMPVVDFFSLGRQRIIYPTWSILLLLITWWCNDHGSDLVVLPEHFGPSNRRVKFKVLNNTGLSNLCQLSNIYIYIYTSTSLVTTALDHGLLSIQCPSISITNSFKHYLNKEMIWI